VRTALRVGSEASIHWWENRFRELGVTSSAVTTRDGRATLDFEDGEGQRLSLVVDGGRGAGNPWEKSPVPTEHQIRGLGPITLSVPMLTPTEAVLTKVMNMRRVREYRLPAATHAPATVGTPKDSGPTVHVYEMGEGGPAAELHVAVEPGLPQARLGAGGVHHVAFRTPTFKEYDAWAERLAETGQRSSGPVDRYYFKSLYFREPGGILFEIATDGPGFASDEPMEKLGERLALPPFLEGRRAEIEAGLKPLDTAAANTR
jgi:glyoxalase family protein